MCVHTVDRRTRIQKYARSDIICKSFLNSQNLISPVLKYSIFCDISCSITYFIMDDPIGEKTALILGHERFLIWAAIFEKCFLQSL